MSQPRPATAPRRALLALVAGLLAPGCSAPGYVVEQAWGQLRVLRDRERIADLLRRPDLPPATREQLRVVLAARRFAHQELGLRLTAAYTRYYDTGHRPLAYNLSACPPDSLRPKVWRFPIVGGLPYIGFFDRARGAAMARELSAQGLDTYLRPVPAFSSLGWFADPVYSSMLDDDVARLADVILHETTHTTIFLRDQIAFNESLAVFVGNQGALSFLARLYGPDSARVKEYRARIVRRRRFGRMISRLYARLEALYASALPRREKLARREDHFRWARQRYKQIFPDPATWGSFVHEPLNNAVLLSYGRYNQGLDFHRRVYRALGKDLGRMVALYKRAQGFADPVGYVARRCGLRWRTRQQM